MKLRVLFTLLATLSLPITSAHAGWVTRDLGTLGGTNSVATGINAAGQVVGYAYTAGNAQQHAFRSTGLAGAGQMTDLGTLGGTYSTATGINATGQVVGYASLANGQQHAFRSTGLAGAGQMTDLGTLGGTYISAAGINAAGQVVGSSFLANGDTHAFRSTGLAGAGQMTDLGTLGGTNSFAIAINAAGQVVGYSQTEFNDSIAPFFYDDGTMFDVRTLVTGFTDLSTNIFLNDLGQLAGTGRNSSGQMHAFLLTFENTVAVPEPASMALFGIGLFGIVAFRRKRRQ